MEYSILGRSGLRVSRLGLGGAPLGGDFGGADEGEMERVVHEALDLGVTFIDTAPLYGKGKSERRIGRALRGGRRSGVVLATKAVRSDLVYTYANTLKSVEDSLGRLETDWIDLLQLHDVETQPEEVIMNETIPAVLKLREQGKIRFIGVTTRKLPVLRTFMETGVFDTIQFYARYMLLDSSAADDIIPLAARMNLGVINGSVLGMGILADRPAPFLREAILEKAQSRVARLAFLRRDRHQGLIEPAMRYSLGNRDIHVTLTGAASLADIRANAGYCDGIGLKEAEERQVRELFRDEPPLFD